MKNLFNKTFGKLGFNWQEITYIANSVIVRFEKRNYIWFRQRLLLKW